MAATTAAYDDAESFDSAISRRHFTIASVIGILVATPPYLLILWGGRLNPLRSFFPNHAFSNFYDIQARSLFHGHLNVPKGSLGIEGFVSRSRDYTYFGPFPSLLRMPVLAVTSRLDGQLTAPSMLLAWLVTGLFTALLLWRIRLLVRGPAVMGRAEAASFGALIATILSGSVLLYLAAMPFVYNEDLAWGAALTVGALFGLLGILERPSTLRVVATGSLILAANLTRSTMGWASVIGAVLAAAWFALGLGGADQRRWRLPVLAAGLLPFAAGCVVTFAKFRTPIGLPMSAQVWAQISERRRQFLAANGGRAFNLRFVPTTALAYLRPNGLRLTPVFPFVTLPPDPPRVLLGALFDQTYRTASAPSSMPIAFLLSIWGLVTAFRPRPLARASLLRIPLLTAGAGTVGVLVWGYISNRYLAEFIPLLCLASAVGLCDIWRRVDGRRRSVRRHQVRRYRHVRLSTTLLGAVVALAALEIAGNVALASTPTEPHAWPAARIQGYVQRQETFSRVLRRPLTGNVMRGSALPGWGPADQLFILDNCATLYISNGESYHTWIPVAYGPGVRRVFDITFHQPSGDQGQIVLLTIGRNLMSTLIAEYNSHEVRIRLVDPLYPVASKWMPVQLGRTYRFTVDPDTQLDSLSVTESGKPVLTSLLATGESDVVPFTLESQTGSPSAVTVTPGPVPRPSLCAALVGPKASPPTGG